MKWFTPFWTHLGNMIHISVSTSVKHSPTFRPPASTNCAWARQLSLLGNRISSTIFLPVFSKPTTPASFDWKTSSTERRRCIVIFVVWTAYCCTLQSAFPTSACSTSYSTRCVPESVMTVYRLVVDGHAIQDPYMGFLIPYASWCL